MNVLLVEDSQLDRKVIKQHLKEMGFEKIIEAKDGIEALEKLHANLVKLVITDWNMPKMNGISLVKSIRSNKLFASVPIIVLTARSDEDDIKEAMSYRINGYVTKPYDPKMFAKKIFSILKSNIKE